MIDKSLVRIGCISWTYPDWRGSFYPEGANSSEFLSLYSQVFDMVEIDSTFYRTPNPSTVGQWRERTPPNFLFSAKLPKKITHGSRLKDVSSYLESFERVIKGLGPKLACIIAQMPPNFKFEKNFELLRSFLDEIDTNVRYAIEFRDASWFREETYSLLSEKHACLAWSAVQSARGNVPTKVTSDFLYLRFMGQFGEFSKFDHVQKEKKDVLGALLGDLEKAPDTLGHAYVLMSNHFEGFAPSSANSFRKLVGLEEIDWKERMRHFTENPKLI